MTDRDYQGIAAITHLRGLEGHAETPATASARRQGMTLEQQAGVIDAYDMLERQKYKRQLYRFMLERHKAGRARKATLASTRDNRDGIDPAYVRRTLKDLRKNAPLAWGAEELRTALVLAAAARAILAQGGPAYDRAHAIIQQFTHAAAAVDRGVDGC